MKKRLRELTLMVKIKLLHMRTFYNLFKSMVWETLFRDLYICEIINKLYFYYHNVLRDNSL